MRKTNQSRLSALVLSAVLAVLIVPIASKSPKADPSASHPPQLASLTGDERNDFNHWTQQVGPTYSQVDHAPGPADTKSQSQFKLRRNDNESRRRIKAVKNKLPT